MQKAVKVGVISLLLHLMDCTYLGNKNTNVCIWGDYKVPLLIHGNCCRRLDIWSRCVLTQVYQNTYNWLILCVCMFICPCVLIYLYIYKWTHIVHEYECQGSVLSVFLNYPQLCFVVCFTRLFLGYNRRSLIKEGPLSRSPRICLLLPSQHWSTSEFHHA